jgi:hypothetical protein
VTAENYKQNNLDRKAKHGGLMTIMTASGQLSLGAKTHGGGFVLPDISAVMPLISQSAVTFIFMAKASEAGMEAFAPHYGYVSNKHCLLAQTKLEKMRL